MKHNWKITIIILSMFLLTQFIGLFVINQYSPIQQTVINNQTGLPETVTIYPENNQLPFGMQPPQSDQSTNFFSIIISFAFAVMLIFLLIKFKFKTVIRVWFFIVIALALGIAFNSVLKSFLTNAWIVSLLFAVPLTFLKVYRPHVIIHNFTELFIYPGISAIFVPILGIWSIIILLILISIYDIWAVWHSGIMQKMAKFHMEEVGVFGGFLIPYLNKKVRAQIQKLKDKKSKKKIKVQIAILGGGDIVFPIITAGVFMRAFGIIPALFVVFGAFAGLTYLLINSQKKKFYPAMPFITAGIFLALLLWKLFF